MKLQHTLILTLLTFTLSPLTVFAQEITVSPEPEMLIPEQEYTYTIQLDGADITNTVGLQLIFPESIELLSFEQNSAGGLIFLPDQCGDSFIDTVNNQLCFVAASTSGDFDALQDFGELTVTASEQTLFSFETGERSSVVIGTDEVFLVQDNDLNDEEEQEVPDVVVDETPEVDIPDEPTMDTTPDTDTVETDETTDTESDPLMQVAIVAWLTALAFITGIMAFLLKKR